MSSCTTTNIPGLDRILFSNSSAKVGPIVTVDVQYPADEEATSAAESVEPVTDAPSSVTVGEAAGTTAGVTQTLPDTAEIEQQVEPQAPRQTSEPVAVRPSAQKTVKSASSSPKLASQAKAKPQSSISVKESAKPKNKPMAVGYGSMSGRVILIGEDGKPLLAKGTLITLAALNASKTVSTNKPQTHIIDMKDKVYQPRFSTINAGDQVVFVNKDNIRHNVFSSSGSNAFDLGTYGAGLKRAVTLKEQGVVKIYCNIHADMATFIAVGDQGLSTKADEQGRYSFSELPVGDYEVTIWNIRGETKRRVSIKALEPAKLVDRIDTTAFKLESHKNKFGGNYSKNSKLFEDEFY